MPIRKPFWRFLSRSYSDHITDGPLTSEPEEEEYVPPEPPSTSSTATAVQVHSASEEHDHPAIVEAFNARTRARLKARYASDHEGHAYCYLGQLGVHVVLSEAQMEEWVNACYRCEADLLHPPASILPNDAIPLQPKAKTMSSDELIPTRSATLTAEPFHRSVSIGFGSSLTCIRSASQRLFHVQRSRSTSSIIPGPGYLMGNFLRWVGKKVVSGFIRIDIRRRLWVIKRLVDDLSGLESGQLPVVLDKQGQKVRRASDDLLELSLPYYKTSHQATAEELALRLENLMYDFEGETFPEIVMSVRLILMPFKIRLEDTAKTHEVVWGLRELLLQVQSGLDDLQSLYTEACEYLISELLSPDCDLAEDWCSTAFFVLQYSVECGMGRYALMDLEERGRKVGALCDMLCEKPSSRVSTHSSALRWVACAGTYIPSLQSHMTRPAAIPLCISSLLQLLDEAQMISSIDEVEEDALLLEINNWWDTLATTVQQEGFGPDALLDGGVAGLLSSIKTIPAARSDFGRIRVAYIYMLQITVLVYLYSDCTERGQDAVRGYAEGNLVELIPSISESVRAGGISESVKEWVFANLEWLKYQLQSA